MSHFDPICAPDCASCRVQMNREQRKRLKREIARQARARRRERGDTEMALEGACELLAKTSLDLERATNWARSVEAEWDRLKRSRGIRGRPESPSVGDVYITGVSECHEVAILRKMAAKAADFVKQLIDDPATSGEIRIRARAFLATSFE